MADDNKNQSVVNALLGSHNRIAADEFEKLWKEVINQRDENLERQRVLEADRASMQSYIDQREKDLSEQLNKMRRDFAQRESELERNIQKRQEMLEADERERHERFAAMNDAAERRLYEAREQQRQLDIQTKAFNEEKIRYDEQNNEKLQRISSTFVGGVITDLKARETSLSSTSFWWGISGGFALLFGLVFSGYSIYETSKHLLGDVSWAVLTFQTLKGAIFLTLAGLFARYAFLLSKRYLNEGLRVSNVVHDVSFGQLYVQSYGSTAGWEQVKDAFSRWHHTDLSVEREKEVLQKDDDLPELGVDLSKLTQLIEAIKSLKG